MKFLVRGGDSTGKGTSGQDMLELLLYVQSLVVGSHFALPWTSFMVLKTTEDQICVQCLL